MNGPSLFDPQQRAEAIKRCHRDGNPYAAAIHNYIIWLENRVREMEGIMREVEKITASQGLVVDELKCDKERLDYLEDMRLLKHMDRMPYLLEFQSNRSIREQLDDKR